MIHFGLAPVPWINKFGYRKLEPFEVHAMLVAVLSQRTVFLRLTSHLAGLSGGSSRCEWSSNTCPSLLNKQCNGERYCPPNNFVDACSQSQNFESTMRWREDANELMATAMLDQVLYPVPWYLKGLVAHVFTSIVDWDSKRLF